MPQTDLSSFNQLLNSLILCLLFVVSINNYFTIPTFKILLITKKSLNYIKTNRFLEDSFLNLKKLVL